MIRVTIGEASEPHLIDFNGKIWTRSTIGGASEPKNSDNIAEIDSNGKIWARASIGGASEPKNGDINAESGHEILIHGTEFDSFGENPPKSDSNRENTPKSD